MARVSEMKRPTKAWVLLSLLLTVGGIAWQVPGQDSSSLASSQASPRATLRVEVAVVNIYCTVKTERGGLVTDVQSHEFEVLEDQRQQGLRYFAQETDLPLTLVLLLDTSPSQAKVLEAEKHAIAQFVQQIVRPVDRVMLITFDANLGLVQEFTAEPEELRQKLDRIRVYVPPKPSPDPNVQLGGTRLFDALNLAAREKLTPEKQRKAIIVVSDGADRGSRVTKKQALEATQRSDTIIYTMGIADPSYYWRAENRGSEGTAVLEELARETGGRAIFPLTPGKLHDAFDQIARELRSQYRLGYTSNNHARDGRFRRLEVRVKRTGLRVQARRGYYAPSS